ncbi:MAG TPA: hypothetical protein PLA51_05100 [Spirochaetota bacterium]|nr:hypothetical protein [Spirochaetota bacterium]HPD78495.1 hypothetical protein [Spirochaetota bacterium]HRS63589.1 hypothetical protein [Spirochaetota bacterium]HRU64406.1 hypothetical protein [Spirochaetota bacterium]
MNNKIYHITSHHITSKLNFVFKLVSFFVVIVSSSCLNYNPQSASVSSLKNYDYVFKVIISEKKMRAMTDEQRVAIEKDILSIENQFKTRLIDTGRMRNADALGRMSLIAAELLSNEQISESIYALMQSGVGIEFSCNEMLRDNLKEQSERYSSEAYANVYTFTGDNSIQSAPWEKSMVKESAERNYRNDGDLTDGENISGNSEIFLQGEFKDEALIQDYYNGVLTELASRSDVITEKSEDGSVKLNLANGVIMEFEANVDDGKRGFKKVWKKVKTLVKENKPRILGALVFATGGLVAYQAGAICISNPLLCAEGAPIAFFSASCLMHSGLHMMKENEYYIGCSFKQKSD